MTNFFTAQLPPIIGELHIAQIAHYAEMLHATQNHLNCSGYLIDYQKNTFAYIPNGSPFLCGNRKEKVMELGFAHYQAIMDSAAFEEFQIVNRKAFDFFHNIALEQRINYTLECCFKMVTKNGANTMVRHCQTPIIVTNTGDIWLSLCTIRPAAAHQNGSTILRNTKQHCEYEYNRGRKTFEKKLKADLGIKEVEILQMVASGFTENRIAEMLFISPNTVKYYKKSIIKKLNVGTIKEAIYRYVAY